MHRATSAESLSAVTVLHTMVADDGDGFTSSRSFVILLIAGPL